MPRPIDRKHTYYSGIDGLRTIAVTVVVLYHLTIPGFQGGLLGVGMFFTLSGYLITTNLMRSWDKRGNLGLSQFWLRRFRRLVPAVILTVVSVLILTAALRREDLQNNTWEALSSLFYVNNWHVIFQQKSYFDNFSGPSPLSHMWSLSVEEQFYLLWPLLLLGFLVALRSRLGAMVATLALSAASFAWMWWLALPVGDNTRVYEGTDTRAGGLLLGAALALWLSSRRASGKTVLPDLRVANGFGAVGLAVVLGMVVALPRESTLLYDGGLLLLSVATCLLIFAVLHQNSVWSRVLGCTPLRWIGERSYGIYLWHMPVIAFMPQAWREQHLAVAAAVTAVVSVALAALSWRLVEDPIRRHGVVEPLRAWRRSRKADAEVGATVSSPVFVRPFPSFVAAGATVVLAAIVAVGATPISVSPTQTSASGAPQMELDPESKMAAKRNAAGGDAKAEDGSAEGTDAGSAAAKPPANAGKPDGTPMMSCTTVVHVGDSTSIGMFAPDQVTDSNETAFATYQEHGAGNVVDSVFGARSTTEGWDDPKGNASYPSALDSVKQLLTQVPKEGTCWVIATGVNDAANISAGGAQSHLERIEAMMDLLGPDARVMWPMVTTNTDSGHYAKANMEKFNAALKEAQKKYPKLRLYDWPSECKPEWFGAQDFAHYSAVGNEERAQRFAAALALAFPAANNGEPADLKVVGSGV